MINEHITKKALQLKQEKKRKENEYFKRERAEEEYRQLCMDARICPKCGAPIKLRRATWKEKIKYQYSMIKIRIAAECSAPTCTYLYMRHWNTFLDWEYIPDSCDLPSKITIRNISRMIRFFEGEWEAKRYEDTMRDHKKFRSGFRIT